MYSGSDECVNNTLLRLVGPRGSRVSKFARGFIGDQSTARNLRRGMPEPKPIRRYGVEYDRSASLVITSRRELARAECHRAVEFSPNDTFAHVIIEGTIRYFQSAIHGEESST